MKYKNFNESSEKMFSVTAGKITWAEFVAFKPNNAKNLLAGLSKQFSKLNLPIDVNRLTNLKLGQKYTQKLDSGDLSGLFKQTRAEILLEVASSQEFGYNLICRTKVKWDYSTRGGHYFDILIFYGRDGWSVDID